MLNRIFKSVLLGGAALVLCATFTACEKEKEIIGVIIVKKSNGVVVSNAAVTLSPDQTHSPTTGELPEQSLTKTNNTDANGRTEFTYELEAILNVDVVKFLGNDTLVGTDIIRLLKGKIVTKVVEIN